MPEGRGVAVTRSDKNHLESSSEDKNQRLMRQGRRVWHKTLVGKALQIVMDLLENKRNVPCLLIFMLFLNFVFLMFGISLLVVATYVQNMFAYFLPITGTTYSGPAIFLMATGSVISCMSFLACCGIIRGSLCMVKTYLAGLLVIINVQLIVGIVAFLFRSSLDHSVTTILREQMQYYLEQPLLKQAWDSTQLQFHCCGVMSAEDWTLTLNLTQLFPPSCCKEPLSRNCYNRSTVPDAIYIDGCKDILLEYMASKSFTLAFIAILFALLEIMGIATSLKLIHKFKEQPPARFMMYFGEPESSSSSSHENEYMKRRRYGSHHKKSLTAVSPPPSYNPHSTRARTQRRLTAMIAMKSLHQQVTGQSESTLSGPGGLLTVPGFAGTSEESGAVPEMENSLSPMESDMGVVTLSVPGSAPMSNVSSKREISPSPPKVAVEVAVSPSAPASSEAPKRDTLVSLPDVAMELAGQNAPPSSTTSSTPPKRDTLVSLPDVAMEVVGQTAPPSVPEVPQTE